MFWQRLENRPSRREFELCHKASRQQQTGLVARLQQTSSRTERKLDINKVAANRMRHAPSLTCALRVPIRSSPRRAAALLEAISLEQWAEKDSSKRRTRSGAQAKRFEVIRGGNASLLAIFV